MVASSSTLELGQKKSDFDKEPVLDRMELQLKKSNIPTKYIKNIDLDWAKTDLSLLIKKHTNEIYIDFSFLFKNIKIKMAFFQDLIQVLEDNIKIIIQFLLHQIMKK